MPSSSRFAVWLRTDNWLVSLTVSSVAADRTPMARSVLQAPESPTGAGPSANQPRKTSRLKILLFVLGALVVSLLALVLVARSSVAEPTPSEAEVGRLVDSYL